MTSALKRRTVPLGRPRDGGGKLLPPREGARRNFGTGSEIISRTTQRLDGETHRRGSERF